MVNGALKKAKIDYFVLNISVDRENGYPLKPFKPDLTYAEFVRVLLLLVKRNGHINMWLGNRTTLSSQAVLKVMKCFVPEAQKHRCHLKSHSEGEEMSIYA